MRWSSVLTCVAVLVGAAASVSGASLREVEGQAPWQAAAGAPSRAPSTRSREATAGSSDPTAPPSSAGDGQAARAPPADPQDPGAPSRAPAADELPVASQPRAPLLHFEHLTLEIGFDAAWQSRTTSSRTRRPYAFGYRQEDDYRRFQETLGLRAGGEVLGERFLRYDLSLRYGLSQEAYDENRPGPDLRERPHGDLFEYDARVTLFPAGPLTATALALKADDRIPRPFLPSLDRRRERYGAELVFSDRVLPMRLSYTHEFEDLTSRSRTLIDDEQRALDELRYEATWQPSEYHQLQLAYEYNDRNEQYSGTPTRFDTVRHYLTLDHVLQFGRDRRSRLETLARFQDESGDLARDVYEVAPQLRLQHTDALATTWRAQYLQESFQGVQLELFRGDAGLTHQLADTFIGTYNLYGLHQQAERGGDAVEWGGTANWSLTRPTRLGTLSAHAGYAHVQLRNDAGSRDGVVIGEALTLRDPLPAYLAHTDVRTSSIVVTDSARRRTFLPGRDYLVVRIGRYTALQRVRTGQILDGQTVLVSYLYAASRGLELGRDRLDLRLQHQFTSGLTPYYATSLQNEDIDRTRFLSYPPRHLNRHRAGVDYRRRRWSAGIEYEFNDDSIDPYQGLHAHGDVSLLETPRETLGARGNFSLLRFRGQEDLRQRESKLLDLGLTGRALLAADLEATANALYRFEDDSLRGRTHGVDVSGALNWKIGLFTASLEIEYDLLDLPDSRDGALAAWIKLRREIPIVSRSP